MKCLKPLSRGLVIILSCLGRILHVARINRLEHSLCSILHKCKASCVSQHSPVALATPHLPTSRHISLHLATSRHIRILTCGQVLKSIRIFQSLEELIAAHPLNRPKARRVSCFDDVKKIEKDPKRYTLAISLYIERIVVMSSKVSSDVMEDTELKAKTESVQQS